MSAVRTYSELILLPTFEERFEYLKLNGKVSNETFGFDRYLNQQFYRSQRWRQLRNQIIIRDNGCDLADIDRPINRNVLIHHMNPVNREDILKESDFLLNPEYLICVSHVTHNAIHYGDFSLLPKGVITRAKGDTKLW